MCHRNPIVSRNRNRRCHSGHDLIRDSILRKKFQFLPASSKEKGISTFKPYHFISFFSFFQKNLINILLHHCMVICSFTYINQSGMLRNPCKYSLTHQAVIYHYICLLQNCLAL